VNSKRAQLLEIVLLKNACLQTFSHKCLAYQASISVKKERSAIGLSFFTSNCVLLVEVDLYPFRELF